MKNSSSNQQSNISIKCLFGILRISGIARTIHLLRKTRETKIAPDKKQFQCFQFLQWHQSFQVSLAINFPGGLVRKWSPWGLNGKIACAALWQLTHYINFFFLCANSWYTLEKLIKLFIKGWPYLGPQTPQHTVSHFSAIKLRDFVKNTFYEQGLNWCSWVDLYEPLRELPRDFFGNYSSSKSGSCCYVWNELLPLENCFLVCFFSFLLCFLYDLFYIWSFCARCYCYFLLFGPFVSFLFRNSWL